MTENIPIIEIARTIKNERKILNIFTIKHVKEIKHCSNGIIVVFNEANDNIREEYFLCKEGKLDIRFTNVIKTF